MNVCKYLRLTQNVVNYTFLSQSFFFLSLLSIPENRLPFLIPIHIYLRLYDFIRENHQPLFDKVQYTSSHLLVDEQPRTY